MTGEEASEHEQYGDDPGYGLLALVVLFCKRVVYHNLRIFCKMGEGGSELDVHEQPAVDCPSVCIEYRTEVAFAQLEPGHEHRRAAYHQYQHEEADEYIVPWSDEFCDCAPDEAYAHADGGEDSGELGYVEGTLDGFELRIGVQLGVVCLLGKPCIDLALFFCGLFADAVLNGVCKFAVR